MMSRKFIGIVAGLTMIATTNQAAFAYGSMDGRICKPQIDAEIIKLGFDRTKITKTKYQVISGGVSGRLVTGYVAWFSSGICDGSVALSLQSDCSFIDTFTRGQCTVDTLKK